MWRTFLHLLAIVLALPSGAALAADGGPYKIIKTARVGGEGGFDYVYADADQRRLYVPRSGQDSVARISVFDLDTLAPVGELLGFNARGATVDPKAHHGFASSKPVVMWDSKTLKVIKTIPVLGNPDGIMFDGFNERVYVFSHAVPNATVIDARDGAVLGTIDLGGAPEQAVSDGRGHVFVAIEDKDNIAVIDAKTMKATANYGLHGKGGTCAGLAFDAKNHILFAACRAPANMVMMNSDNGKILGVVPIGAGVDGAVFNPKTMEVFSSQGDGTLTVVKEAGHTKFTVEQSVQTMTSAKTLTLDRASGRVLLIGGEFGPSTPPTTSGGRAVRGPLLPGSFTILSIGK